MADRKKVQKIRLKRVGKSETSKKEINNTTQSIDMNSQKRADVRKTPISNYSSQKRTYHNQNGTSKSKSNSNISKKTKRNTNNRSQISFSVIHGKKGEIQKKNLITICISSIIIISILIFCFTSPTGPVERITNSFEILGSGEFSTVLSGTKTLAFETINNKAFTLTNSHLFGHTISGKNFLQLQHNFSNPILEVSEERTLIYNRENNRVIIANNSGLIFEQNLDKPIFCGDISYNGNVAFACESASYSAQILVFNKNMEQYYTWYLADGLVSDIALSNNGEYVAIAVLKVKNGEFVSNIYCLNTDEKEPVFTKELVGESVLKIESVSGSNFAIASDKKVSFIKWKNGEETNVTEFGTPSYFNNMSKYLLVLFGETNHSDIVLFNSSGEIKHKFEFNGIVDDVSIFDETVFVLSGNKIIYFDFYEHERKTLNLDNNADFILGVEDGVVTLENINMDFVYTTQNNQ